MQGKEKTGKDGKKEAAGKTGKSSGTAGSSGAAGVKFNPMDEVRNTVTQVLKDTANHEILVLNIPMAGFESFIGDLQALLTLIQS